MTDTEIKRTHTTAAQLIQQNMTEFAANTKHKLLLVSKIVLWVIV